VDTRSTVLADIPERIIFVNDMVPFGFAAGAARCGQSVARLIVPRFDNGQPRTQPFTDQQIQYFGTGWLLGGRHIITNHHVVNARDPGEADASLDDFALQGENTTVQFDYNQRNAAGDPRTVQSVAAANKKLDYAILELESPTGREPLTVLEKEFDLPSQSYVPVNLIQHPGGNPKTLGIRNNLVATVKDINIAYFTDTEPGSSGSPVCTDNWQVIALHKASSASFGEFEFQGKKTAWVNIGTCIHHILKDLREHHTELWNAIGAIVE
jgi:endonuclease G, mitochondrial